jgi:peptidyl-prolyl cis-trans isomerase SurA
VSRTKVFLASIVACAALLAPARDADAVIVERVVAVVGDQPILLSELRHRARPNLLRLVASGRDANYQAAAQTEIFKALLNAMIDDRLVEIAARRGNIQVTDEEVDRGITNIAAQAKMSVTQALDEIRRQMGLSEVDYRAEIRRQILQAKLVELRVRPRVRVTEQDARAAYQHWRTELAQEQPLELHMLALRVPQPGTEEMVQKRFRIAEEVVKRAHAGEDFCSLIQQFTDDEETRFTCGSRGPQPRRLYYPAILEAMKSMKPNDISPPIHIRADVDAVLVFQLLTEPKIPAYDEVKQEMSQRAVVKAIERQTRLWLDELRRGVYVDVRL